MPKILVIEDEQGLREEIVDILGFEGFETAGASNGQVGLEMARTFRPDMIVCDIMMPVLDGYGVLLELRSDPQTATIPFLFLTARAERSDMRRGMILGADDYLIKPFRNEELLEAIQARLEHRRLLTQHYEGQIEDLRHAIAQTLPHELRTPITAILGYSMFIIEGWETMERDKIRNMADSIYRAGTRLSRLVENYLLYAQLELMDIKSDKISKLKKFLVANPAYPANIVKLQAQEKAHFLNRDDDLILEIKDVAVQVSADDIRKVVDELLDNAFKFSKPGTPVRVQMNADSRAFYLTVSDQGRGMSQETIDRIGAYVQFDRKIFEQQGAGLGLSITQRLIELNQGEMLINSVLDEGTTVQVIFPIV